MIEDVCNVATREDTQLQRAPLQRYVVRYSNGTICYPFGIRYVLKLSIRVSVPRRQLSRMSNEAAFRLHESRGQGPDVLETFVEVNINLSVSKIFL